MNSNQQQQYNEHFDNSPAANKRVRRDGPNNRDGRVARRFPEPENAARTTTLSTPRSRQGSEFRAMVISDEMKGARLSVEDTAEQQRQQQKHYPQQQQLQKHHYQQQQQQQATETL